MLTPVLTAADALAWRRRLPLAALRPGLLSVMVTMCVVATVVTWSDDAWTDQDASGPGGAISAAATGLAVAAAVVLAFRPRAGVWLAAVGSAACVVDPHGGGLGALWAVVAVLSLVLGVLDLAGAASQRVAARRWGAVVVPDVDEPTRAAMLRPRWLVLGVAAVGLATAVLGSWLWAHDTAAVRAFRSVASVATGTVVAVDTDGERATVEVDGRHVRIPSDVLSYSVGDQVTVRFAPSGTRAEDLQEVFDPTGAVFLLALGLSVGAVALDAEVRRRRATAALLRVGGTALLARAGAGVGLLPLLAGQDGPTFALLDLVSPDEPVADRDDAFEAVPDDLSTASDEELLAAANLLADLEDEPESEPPAVPAGAELLVVGLTAYGDRPLVRVDGRWWWSSGPARDPWPLSRLWRRTSPVPVPGAVGADVVPAPASGPSGVAASPAGGLGVAVTRAVGRVVRRTPLAVPFVLGPVVIVPVVRWVGPDLEVRDLLPLAATALVAHAWVAAIRPRLRLAPAGLWVSGGVTDELVPWSRVERVLADGSALVVRVHGDALLLPVRPQSPPLLAGDPDTAAAVSRIEEARSAALLAPVAPAGGATRRPSLAFVAAVLWGGCGLGTALVILVGG